jgi:pentatricopeptide repeat protein
LNGARDAIWFGIRRLLTHADLSTALSAADFELAIECMCHAGDVDAAVHMLQLLLRNRHRPSPRVFLWLVDAMLHAIARSAATCVYANVCNRIADLDRLLRLIAVHRVEIAPPTVALIVRALLDSFYFSVRSGQGTSVASIVICS